MSTNASGSPVLSLLIPIYNVQRYLRECLDSALAQTLKDIEIICINDGSTDNSPAIIREYMERDRRVKMIDKANSGYGDSKYDFDSINSYVTRLGMRWTRDFDQIRSLYAGIGWDYEAGSKARPPTQAGIPQARPSKAPAASSNSAGRARSTIPTHGASTSRPPAGPASRKAVPSLRPSAITFK